jgi:hypothetical protein
MAKEKYVFELRVKTPAITRLEMRYTWKGITTSVLTDGRVKTTAIDPEVDVVKGYNFYEKNVSYRIEFNADMDAPQNPDTIRMKAYLRHPSISSRFDELFPDVKKPNPQFELVDIGNAVKMQAEKVSRMIDIGYRIKNMSSDDWRDIAYRFAPTEKKIVNMTDEEVFLFLADPNKGICMKFPEKFEQNMIDPMGEMIIVVAKAYSVDIITMNGNKEYCHGGITCGTRLEDVYNYLRSNPKVYENIKLNVARSSKDLPIVNIDYSKTPIDIMKDKVVEAKKEIEPIFEKADYTVEEYAAIAKKIKMKNGHLFTDKEALRNAIIKHCALNNITEVPGPEQKEKTLDELIELATSYGLKGMKVVKDADKLYQMIKNHCETEGIETPAR